MAVQEIKDLRKETDLSVLHEHRIDPEGFELFLLSVPKTYGAGAEEFPEPGIEYQVASQFIMNIRALSRRNPERPILIHMMICGGYDEQGMAIYDAICACPNHVTILSYAHARSMSLTVLQAADKRVLMPHAFVLFHEGTPDTTAKTHRQQQTIAKWAKYDLDVMIDIYARKLKDGNYFRGKSLAVIKRELKRRMEREEDCRITSETAIEWGFADQIFDFKWNRLPEPLRSRPRLVRTKVR